jgi:hypothetical protein
LLTLWAVISSAGLIFEQRRVHRTDQREAKCNAPSGNARGFLGSPPAWSVYCCRLAACVRWLLYRRQLYGPRQIDTNLTAGCCCCCWRRLYLPLADMPLGVFWRNCCHAISWSARRVNRRTARVALFLFPPNLRGRRNLLRRYPPAGTLRLSTK